VIQGRESARSWAFGAFAVQKNNQVVEGPEEQERNARNSDILLKTGLHYGEGKKCGQNKSERNIERGGRPLYVEVKTNKEKTTLRILTRQV